MKLLLIGAGYLARKIISNSPTSHVTALRRQAAPEDLIKSARYEYGDFFSLENRLILNMFNVFDGTMIIMLSPSAYTKDIEKLVSRAACLFDHNLLKKVVLVSSTGVFSDGYDFRIDSSYQPKPKNERARRILAIENEWRQQFKNVIVIRLGGLYCIERVVGLNTLLSGKVLDGDGHEYLNLIHSIDAARAILQLCLSQIHEGTFSITDCNPVKRSDYYHYVAKLFGTNPPAFSNNARSSYACIDHDVWTSLTLVPRYPNYVAGLT